VKGDVRLVLLQHIRRPPYARHERIARDQVVCRDSDVDAGGRRRHTGHENEGDRASTSSVKDASKHLPSLI
jgi:hypothetical protein